MISWEMLKPEEAKKLHLDNNASLIHKAPPTSATPPPPRLGKAALDGLTGSFLHPTHSRDAFLVARSSFQNKHACS